MKRFMRLYRFVACFTGECCIRPHLWYQEVRATNAETAKKKVIRDIRHGGTRTIHEIVETTDGMAQVEEVEN